MDSGIAMFEGRRAPPAGAYTLSMAPNVTAPPRPLI
jgi:hypothetical protein